MRIQHNIMAMSAYRNYNTNTSAVAKNLEKQIGRHTSDSSHIATSRMPSSA